jgi:hypothetical protein
VKKGGWLSFCILHSAFCIGWVAVATTRGEDGTVKPPVAKGLLSGLFHEKPRAQARMETKAGAEKPQPVSTVESTAIEQERQKNAWFRRVEVCDRLRMIANQTGNEALMNQANELEERANAIYRRQTSRLPLPAQAPLSVLAADQENLSRDRKGAVATTPALLPTDRSSGRARLSGSMDQREQAILNGKSMGEK